MTLVHHTPKDGTSSDPRGHSSLKGGVDTMILVEGTQHTEVARLTNSVTSKEAKLISFTRSPRSFSGNDKEKESRSTLPPVKRRESQRRTRWSAPSPSFEAKPDWHFRFCSKL